MEQEIINKNEIVRKVKEIFDMDIEIGDHIEDEFTEEEKMQIAKSRAEIAVGNFITHEEVCKRFGIKCPIN